MLYTQKVYRSVPRLIERILASRAANELSPIILETHCHTVDKGLMSKAMLYLIMIYGIKQKDCNFEMC